MIVTMTEFFTAVCRQIECMTAEEKADFRRSILARHEKSEQERLLKMKPATERIQ